MRKTRTWQMLHLWSFSVEICNGEASNTECSTLLRLRTISSSLNPVLTHPILSPSSSNSYREGETWIIRLLGWDATWNRLLFRFDLNESWFIFHLLLWVDCFQVYREREVCTSYDILSTSRRQSWYRSWTSMPPNNTLVWNIIICKLKQYELWEMIWFLDCSPHPHKAILYKYCNASKRHLDDPSLSYLY